MLRLALILVHQLQQMPHKPPVTIALSAGSLLAMLVVGDRSICFSKRSICCHASLMLGPKPAQLQLLSSA